jgi:hypothetical protein
VDQDALKLLQLNTARWRANPVLFVFEMFGVILDAWQEDALMRLAQPTTRRLAMKACKGPGKTAVLAWAILWFLTCHANSHVGATSITEGNIDTNLWPELYKWLSRSAYLRRLFKWSRSRVQAIGNPDWFCEKRTWPKSGNPDEQANALAGLHADYVAFFLDEVGGIPLGVMVTAEAVLAGHHGRALIVIAGNPTHTTGPLYRACTTDKELWEIVTITGDPDDPMRSPRISMDWAREEIGKYGRDNPWVMVNVLGQFPPSSINALLGVQDVDAAMLRQLAEDAYSWSQKRIGVDVARFGDDRTILSPRQGLMAFPFTEMRNADTAQIAGRVARGAVRWGAEMILIDDTGHWGHGVLDQLTTAGFPAVPVNYAGSAIDPRYRNIRAENWVLMANWVKKGGKLPNDPGLVAELTEITYTFVNGRFVLEEKDQVKQRLGRSPDKADALSTTFAMPDMPGGLATMLPGYRGQGGVAVETDPYGLTDTVNRSRTHLAGHVEAEDDPFR